MSVAGPRFTATSALPCEIGEGGIVQVADDADWSLLLRVVNQDGILRCNRIHNPVGKRKGAIRRGWCGVVGRSRGSGWIGSGTWRVHRSGDGRRWQSGDGVIRRRSVDRDVVGRHTALSERIQNRGTLDCDRGFLVARKVRNWGLVEPGTGVNVHRVDDVVRSLRTLPRQRI